VLQFLLGSEAYNTEEGHGGRGIFAPLQKMHNTVKQPHLQEAPRALPQKFTFTAQSTSQPTKGAEFASSTTVPPPLSTTATTRPTAVAVITPESVQERIDGGDEQPTAVSALSLT
jgi:cytoskeletal protein RodZ